MSELLPRRKFVIDFEASAFPSREQESFPVEVAIGDLDTGRVVDWLIRPAPEWLDAKRWRWSERSERIHGLSLEYLQENGRPRAAVAQEVMAQVDGGSLWSDNPAFDQLWLYVLAGERYPGIRIRSLGTLFQKLAGPGPIGQERLQMAGAWARIVAPKSHRAAADVRNLIATWHELGRLASQR
jgi:hypothetical protein